MGPAPPENDRYVVIQFTGPTMPLVAFAGFTALQITISPFPYPMLQRRGMALPPVMIMVALMVCGSVWGLAGALLALPLAAALVIIIVCQHLESTEWVAKLLGHGK